VPKIFIEYLGNSVQVPYGETVGGRDLTCGLRFNDPAVSRRHLRLVRRRDDVFIEDLGSSNGTVVNEQTLAGARRLEHGDTIQLGTRRLTIHVVTGERDAELSTLNLKDLSQVPRATLRRGKTALQATVPPPAVEGHHRCPECAAPVADGGPSPVFRRRHDRQPIELRLIYTSDQLEVEATTRDLSASGVFVC
jgi:predicted component of type VI protein secretion system